MYPIDAIKVRFPISYRTTILRFASSSMLTSPHRPECKSSTRARRPHIPACSVAPTK
jgi:hypothetical protein